MGSCLNKYSIKNIKKCKNKSFFVNHGLNKEDITIYLAYHWEKMNIWDYSAEYTKNNACTIIHIKNNKRHTSTITYYTYGEFIIVIENITENDFLLKLTVLEGKQELEFESISVLVESEDNCSEITEVIDDNMEINNEILLRYVNKGKCNNLLIANVSHYYEDNDNVIIDIDDNKTIVFKLNDLLKILGKKVKEEVTHL